MSANAALLARIEAFRQLGLLEMAKAGAKNHIDGERKASHRLSAHQPIWRFCNPVYATDNRYFPDGRPLFGFHGPDDALDDILAQTSWLVFLGAADSPLLRQALARPDALCLVFEPSLTRFHEFIASFDIRKNASPPFFFVGDHHGFAAPLMETLPKQIVDRGHPVVFVQDGLEHGGDYQSELIEKIEFFYYRHAIYQYEGHWGRSGLPSRAIHRGLFYDQQRHMYENIPDYLEQGTINDLTNAFAGETALIVAGGPALDAHIGFVKANRDKAVVICVNSALRTLLANGVTPHFTIINDTSLDSEATIAGLPRLPGARLVAHAVASSGHGAFENVFFFGNVLPELLPVIPMLRLHGSVASTGFSLARHLGCARVVFAGLQMAGNNPWSLGYAKDSVQAGQGCGHDAPPTGAFPQLYPVRAANGARMYTTLNFYDSTLWLLDEIERSGVEAVNLCAETIVHGPGVTVDPDYAIPEGGDIAALAARITPTPQTSETARIRDYMLGQIEFWRLVRKMAEEDVSLSEHPEFPRLFANHLSAWDNANVSFLLERLPGFDIIGRVYAGYFGDCGEEAKKQAALAYLEGCRDMAKGFVKVLSDGLMRIKAGSTR